METGLSASDVALINDRNNNDWGDNGFMWIFALLILFWGGNGAWGNRNGAEPVTESALCNANSFNELKSSVGRLNDQVNSVNTNLGNAICSLGYETLQNFNTLERQLADCCCTTQRAIDSVNFNISQSTAAINANTTASMQKILDQLCADRAAQQAARIQQLELNQALCGVVRYPNAMTYTAGFSPFCGCNTGCGTGCCNGVNI